MFLSVAEQRKSISVWNYHIYDILSVEEFLLADTLRVGLKTNVITSVILVLTAETLVIPFTLLVLDQLLVNRC